MIAKNKGDFLYQLHNELHRIGIDNDDEIFADFEAHFKASEEAGIPEEETCEKLGDVEALWVLPDGELHMTSGMEAILVPDDTSGESQS